MEFMVKEFSTVIVHSRHQLRVPKSRVLRITGWECTIISIIVMQTALHTSKSDSFCVQTKGCGYNRSFSCKNSPSKKAKFVTENRGCGYNWGAVISRAFTVVYLIVLTSVCARRHVP